MKLEAPAWVKRNFSIKVIFGGSAYFTTREPFKASAEEALAAVTELVGKIDEKIMLYQTGGYKIPSIRLVQRYSAATICEEYTLISAHALSRSVVHVLLVEEKA